MPNNISTPLHAAEQARCGVVDVLPGSVLVFIQAVTTELYGGNLEQAAVLLENGNQDALLLLLQALSVSDAQVSVLSVEFGVSFAESNDFSAPSGVRNVRATPFASECVMQADVTWDKPANDGGASVSKYFISCSSDTAISPPGAVVNFDVLSVTIGPFQPGNFICSVKALNAAGTGVEADSQTFSVMCVPLGFSASFQNIPNFPCIFGFFNLVAFCQLIAFNAYCLFASAFLWSIDFMKYLVVSINSAIIIMNNLGLTSQKV